ANDVPELFRNWEPAISFSGRFPHPRFPNLIACVRVARSCCKMPYGGFSAQDYAVLVSEFVRKFVATVSARATERFSQSADRRGAGPRRAAVLVRRSSAEATRPEQAVQFPVAAKQAPCPPSTPR